MNIGDLVMCRMVFRRKSVLGIVIGFNERGEGGKDYVHVLLETNKIEVFLSIDVEIISGGWRPYQS